MPEINDLVCNNSSCYKFRSISCSFNCGMSFGMPMDMGGIHKVLTCCNCPPSDLVMWLVGKITNDPLEPCKVSNSRLLSESRHGHDMNTNVKSPQFSEPKLTVQQLFGTVFDLVLITTQINHFLGDLLLLVVVWFSSVSPQTHFFRGLMHLVNILSWVCNKSSIFISAVSTTNMVP